MRNLFLTSVVAFAGLLPFAELAYAQKASVSPTIPHIKVYQPKATATARLEQRQGQMLNIRPENYDFTLRPLTDAHASHWLNVLWATTVLEPEAEYVKQALDKILLLATNPKLSNTQKRIIDSAFQVGSQLYLRNPSFYENIGQKFLLTIDYSNDSQWVAIALSSLAQNGMEADKLAQLQQRIQQRFPRWSQDLFLSTTFRQISEAANPPTVPLLSDLMQWQVVPNQPHLYVLCQPNRELLCRAVLKDRNGQFVRENGQLWSVPLLLQSIYALNWNFFGGKTPQGIYRIEGTVPQPDDEVFRAYGQFPLVKVFSPFENGVKEFLPKRKGKFTGNLQAYQALLPNSWRNYAPMQQSYWAGKIGRSLFRIHGSGEAVDLFKGKDAKTHPDSYAWNRTLGCLSALETYNAQGQLQQADMPKILSMLKATSSKDIAGYLVVVDVPSKSGEALSLAEIEKAIAPIKP